MKKVNLGSQGLCVPAIGLGCMGMSEFYGSSSEAQNLGVLDRAAEIGCTFWDTSDMYGPFTNEILLSKGTQGTPRPNHLGDQIRRFPQAKTAVGKVSKEVRIM